MDWGGRSALVTGGNGFLGSHLVRALISRGAAVTALVREPCPLTDDAIAMATRTQGDVCDIATLGDVARADVVFHLAARPIVGEAASDPLPVFDVNVAGTWNVLEAVRRGERAAAVVVVTSDKVYGEAERLPSTETDHLTGSAPYEASKVCADVIARCYARSFRLPIAVARLGNLYGPGDAHWSRIVPGTIRSLLAGERPVIRSDGEALRDYLYVEDAAEALATMAGALADDSVSCGEAFNFGTGQPTLVRDVVRLITLRSGTSLEPIVQCTASGEIRAQYLDCAKASRLLGWAPKTPLPTGIDQTWQWYETSYRERQAQWEVGREP